MLTYLCSILDSIHFLALFILIVCGSLIIFYGFIPGTFFGTITDKAVLLKNLILVTIIISIIFVLTPTGLQFTLLDKYRLENEQLRLQIQEIKLKELDKGI